ncbi:torsin-1A-like [Scomber japonicus]|uniref:torsin-1A-like n=1 Tax=Scomber japonicus TaxID=13676 RepID=UPI00230552BB|nr:torsin-1A-like [Scomber japonicus]
MKAMHAFLLICIVLTCGAQVKAFDPTVIFEQKCDFDWISFRAAGLQGDLKSKLFGQHVALPIILKAVNGFMSNDNSEKPLVLSLHGPTGTGKNFVSNMIADNIYKEGINSRFVHVFISTLHFPHVHQIDTYKSQLQQWIKGNVTNCGRSMFIFDEVDKMHPGVIDSIKPYLDYYNKVDGVSYRKAIFIFLSNADEEGIKQTALDFWKKGQDRSEIRLKDMETLLSTTAFKSKKSDIWISSLIEQNMVDFFVPFLPLEYTHVVQCVMAQMKTKGLEPDPEVAHKVASDLDYFPKFERVFSVSGCKTITSRLHFYIHY